mmetsp:Transcript_20464/g.29298  ORF Transcript_20464/g.29298 Transcript_20464/m.29298 type:complete len:265 (-) Transcript_20464:166-960(-)|eukprot:CAMPEP_0201685474 /NCGR_PEP_ID=MMETSP0578-20130828/212_1 /ASSEMBLY_ACC=CAM_ASM_000663 /TAXON_ID=267565 /ORGANISM="Skeletonema grethea, Strain CCMP 1804" /LENGTH=264 /DNA_ID=CAMNT_0048169365 /DNA_START=62 /DNA_END=856 /DNA_ORIENTATION=-
MMTLFSPALTIFAVLPSIAAAFVQPQTFTLLSSASIRTLNLKNIKAPVPLQITREEGLWQSSLHASSLADATAYPEGMSPEEELEYLKKVAAEYFPSQKDEDTPDIDELMKAVATMQAREEPNPEDVGILEEGCAVAVVIDTIALALSIIGLKGSAPKTVARSMYGKLPRSARKDLTMIIAKMNRDNFARSVYDVIKLVYENLTWNALKDSFKSLGWWDATTFALSFAAIFASGGTAFIINVGLATAATVKLLYDISQCEEIVG